MTAMELAKTKKIQNILNEAAGINSINSMSSLSNVGTDLPLSKVSR